MGAFNYFFRKFILGTLVFLVYRLISLTWRIRLIEAPDLLARLENREPMIFSHWHGDEIVLVYLTRRYRIATITSTSKDGELMNTVIRLLGGVTTRGSSTRGGTSALKGLLRRLKTGGHNCSLAVDGPKGPLHQVKPGVFEVSRLVQAPIYVPGITCDSCWVLLAFTFGSLITNIT